MTDPRYDLDAERALIGAAILSNEEARTLTVEPQDFYDPRHASVWAIIARLIEDGRNVDLVTLHQHLIAEPIPGMDAAYLHECTRSVSTSALAPTHARIITGLSKLRRVRAAGQQAITATEDAPWDAAEAVLDTMRQELADVEARVGTATAVPFADVIRDALTAFEEVPVPPVPTGWEDLDEHIAGGWKPGQMTVVGARPSVGKTLVATNVIANADTAGARATYYNLEMSQHEVAARLIAAKAQVTTATIEKNELTAEQWARVARVQAEAANSSIGVVSDPTLSVADIRADVARAHARGDTPAVIVVDYLQLLTPAARDRDASRERQVSNLARDLKVLALQYGLHVVVLAQVNRSGANRADPRPLMSDLRESGGIEQHADNVILLYRDDEANPGVIEFILAKNRHGPTGCVELAWIPRRSTIATMGTYVGGGL